MKGEEAFQHLEQCVLYSDLDEDTQEDVLQYLAALKSLTKYYNAWEAVQDVNREIDNADNR